MEKLRGVCIGSANLEGKWQALGESAKSSK